MARDRHHRTASFCEFEPQSSRCSSSWRARRGISSTSSSSSGCDCSIGRGGCVCYRRRLCRRSRRNRSRGISSGTRAMTMVQPQTNARTDCRSATNGHSA